MDSLLQNYASSDEEGDAEFSQPILPPKSSNPVTHKASSSLLSSLPPPRSSTLSSSSPSSSLTSSLPPPKIQFPSHPPNDVDGWNDEGEPSAAPPVSSMFSFLPRPKTSTSSTFTSIPVPKSQSKNSSSKLSSDQNRKRIVHVTLPLNPSMLNSQDSDDDDDEEKRRKARRDGSSSSTPNSLSSILPAPKNSLCIAPAQSSGTSRRFSLHEVIPSQNSAQAKEDTVSIADYSYYSAEDGGTTGYYDTSSYNAVQGVSDYENYTNDEGICTVDAVYPGAVGLVDPSHVSNPAITCWEEANGNSVGYGSYMDSISIASFGEKQSNIPHMGRITGKRGRTDIPTEIVEVKQDELMKNRPREDQVRLTGIAFGPAYQPAPSGKGKPSKLHKRKHQIGSLYYDLKQKEMELAERRSRGLLTKSETQAKYGW